MPKLTKRSDGRYAMQIYLGTENGKRKYKTVYGRTQKDVTAKAAELKLKMGKGIDIGAADSSFLQWATMFLEDKKTEGVGHSHYSNLESFTAHLSPIHNLPLSKISTADIQAIINKLADWHEGKPPLSKRTLNGVKGVARQVFEKAIESRVVDFNPAIYVKIPKNAAETHRDMISPEQQAWIREMQHKAQLPAMIMLYGGLRRGEMLALTWADVDFDNATIAVNKSVEFIGNDPRIKKPKTEAGIRIVNIPDILVEFLKANKNNCLYCVHNRNGNLHTLSSWRKLWESYMKALNDVYGYTFGGQKAMTIKTFTPHELRHTCCSIMIMAGMSVLTVKEQMGHSDIKTTLGIYAHINPDYKKEDFEKLNNFLRKSDASQAKSNNA